MGAPSHPDWVPSFTLPTLAAQAPGRGQHPHLAFARQQGAPTGCPASFPVSRACSSQQQPPLPGPTQPQDPPLQPQPAARAANDSCRGAADAATEPGTTAARGVSAPPRAASLDAAAALLQLPGATPACAHARDLAEGLQAGTITSPQQPRQQGAARGRSPLPPGEPAAKRTRVSGAGQPGYDLASLIRLLGPAVAAQQQQQQRQQQQPLDLQSALLALALASGAAQQPPSPPAAGASPTALPDNGTAGPEGLRGAGAGAPAAGTLPLPGPLIWPVTAPQAPLQPPGLLAAPQPAAQPGASLSQLQQQLLGLLQALPAVQQAQQAQQAFQPPPQAPASPVTPSKAPQVVQADESPRTPPTLLQAAALAGMLAAASQPQLQQQAGCSPRAHRPEAETQAGRPDVRGSAAAADAPAAAVPGSPQAPGPATPLNSPFEHAVGVLIYLQQRVQLQVAALEGADAGHQQQLATLQEWAQKVKACLRQMQQQWRELVGVMQAAVAETAGELRRQHDLLARLAAAESPRQTQHDRQDQQAEQGQHEGAAQQPAPPPKREEEGAASPAPQPGGPGAVLVQQMLAMQAADVERSKRFAELAQACQQAGQHAQQVAFENAALRKQLNLLWNNQKQQQAQAEKLAAQLGALREERQQREQLEGTVAALQQRVAALQAERPEGG